MGTVKITVTLETITPSKAADWLGRNTRNRHIRASVVEHFAAAMRRGEWTVNAETIKFDRNGVLIDGQHRLLAVIESGTTIKAFVAHNLPPEAQQTIDVGTRRRFADELTMRGFANAAVLAAALTWIYRFEQHAPRDASCRPTIPEGLGLFDRHPNLPLSIAPAKSVSERLGGPVSMYAFLHYHFASLDGIDADDFFHRLGTGEGLDKGSPILALRRLLERARQDKQSNLSQSVRMAVFIKAWNLYRDGEEVQTLSWRAGGANPEKWPVAR